MAIPNFFKTAQSSARSGVPLVFTYLEVGGYGSDAAPGVYAPLLADVDGNLFVTLGGSGGGPILLPDNADGVAEIATDSRLPTVARLYALNQNTGNGDEFERLRIDDEETEARGESPTSFPLRVQNQERLFQNTDGTYRRKQANGAFDIAASAARTVTTTFGNFFNTNWRAFHYIINVTVIGADTLTINIEGRVLFPPFNFYPLLISLPISSTGVTVLKIGQGFTPIANLTANNMVPYISQVVAEHSGVDPITYSIAANAGV